MVMEDVSNARNYVVEMRAVVDAEASGEYISGVVAAHIVEKLRATDPALLAGWLDMQAVTLLHAAINERDRSRRTAARYATPRSVFAAAAGAHEAGDSGPLRTLMAMTLVVNEENLRKPLGSMTREDLRYASGCYTSRASEAAMEAAWLTAIAKKVAAGTTVRDHYTEQQLVAMRDSLRAS